MRTSSLTWLCALLLVVTPLSMAFAASPLPDLNSPNAQILSKSEEQQWGRQFLRQIQRRHPLIRDPLLLAYIQNLGKRLVSHANTQDQHFQFFLIDDPAINALAGPNGYIGVNSGLLLSTQTEGELASVMAHEIAHVTQYHLARSVKAAKQQLLPTIGALLAAATIGGPLGTGLMMAGLGGSQQHMLDLQREKETEADQIGMEILQRSGFDPRSMAHFFYRLQADNRYYYNVPEFLRTHPLTTSRIAESENRTWKSPRLASTPSLTYDLMRARIQVLTTSELRTVESHYKADLTKHGSPAARYGYALALLKDHQIVKATDQTKRLLEGDPEQLIYQMLLSTVYLAGHHPTLALAELEKAYALYPDNFPLLLQYGDTLLQAKKAKAAVALLKAHEEDDKRRGEYLALLARAYAATGDRALAYQTRAQLFLLADQTSRALQQLKIALSYAKDDRRLATRITSEIGRVKSLASLRGA